MIQTYYRNVRDRELQYLESARVGSWIHLEDPTEKELSQLQERYNLEAGLLHDATDLYEVPRMEIEEGVVYIFTRFPISRGGHVFTSPILCILGKDVFITITKESFASLENFIKKTAFYTTQKNKLLIQIFKLINTGYNTYLHSISRQIRISTYELEKITNKDIVQFVNYERVLNDFHLALVRTNSLLKVLLSYTSIKLFEEDKDLIEDLFLSNDQLVQLSDENLKSIVNIRDAYTTIMTNNTNRVIRFFTSVTVILTIPTIIASIFGMNVALPFADHAFAFTGIMLGTLVITIFLVWVFIWNDWL